MNQRGPIGYKLRPDVAKEIDVAYAELAAVVKPFRFRYASAVSVNTLPNPTAGLETAVI